MIHLLLMSILSSAIQDDKPSYLKYLNPEKIGIKQIEIDADSTIIERRYLGELKLSDSSYENSINYHVVSEFRLIPAASSHKGRSSLLFIDENGILVRQYNMGLPSNLPTVIKDKLLIFENKALILNHLLELLCIPSGACFEWEE
jgi:hypothetical protein